MGSRSPGPKCELSSIRTLFPADKFPSRWVLGLGRLVEKKGFDLLIEAFSRIAYRHPGVALIIAGEGPTRRDLERLALKHGLEERVRFTGRLDARQVADTMAEADVVVVPSRVEPFGIVVLEAWRGATTVIATNRGGTKEFVRDGSTESWLIPWI